MRETRETRFSWSSPHFYWLLLVIVKSIVLYRNMSSDRYGPDLIGPVRYGPDLIGPVRFGPDRVASYRTDLNQSGSVRSGSFGPVLTMYYIS